MASLGQLWVFQGMMKSGKPAALEAPPFLCPRMPLMRVLACHELKMLIRTGKTEHLSNGLEVGAGCRAGRYCFSPQNAHKATGSDHPVSAMQE